MTSPAKYRLAQQRGAALDRLQGPNAFGGKDRNDEEGRGRPASPSVASIKRPINPSRSARARRSTPTVAEMTA
jgi:hypothetical protein